MDTVSLGQCSLYMQTIFKKCPFKENGKLLKLFCLILWGLNSPVGSDTPQNKILRGIRPCRTRSCGVSDPAEPSLAGYQTPQNNERDVYILQQMLVLRGLIPCRTMILRLTRSCGVSDPTERSSAAYHTPGNNFKYEYFREFETEFKNILGYEFGDYMGSIHGKNQRSKISCYCPFKGTVARDFWPLVFS